ncbi:PREDICTED: uncharacterized protein LOC18589223 [Theobroma cacao]|uniref:Uncharacterized protein LOC18589223 n=1 Tax=Theobroma cacao TaxID=3641 RepID=A0AB32WT49_THECC|nr:PREDICTED: uncharacterized protein LOC18589223 [Theobroma cacao]
MQRDEDKEDDMEGDENEDEDQDQDQIEDDDCETFNEDSDNNEKYEFVYSGRTMVKRKHSKLRPRSTNASGSISLPINASAFIDISIQPQMQRKYNDVPFQTPSLLGASVEQVENETSTHNSHRSPSTDLGASVDDTSSRSRSRGLSVGLQTPVDPSDRLHITPIGERSVVMIHLLSQNSIRMLGLKQLEGWRLHALTCMGLVLRCLLQLYLLEHTTM